MDRFLFRAAICALVLLASCAQNEAAGTAANTAYFAPTADAIQTGGVRLIPIATPKGSFNVWTKRIGSNPRIKLLLLNGGPGMSHEYFECMESFLPAEGIEFIYYDQLGTGFSDNPKDTVFWDLPRYVDEVEQVRKALKLDKDNFFLLGHSWGGILAIEYALKYPERLKGLVISNMMASAPEYGKYSGVLAAKMDPVALRQIRDIEARKDFSNPKYIELLMPNFYEKHILRLPLAKWPEPVNRAFSRLNQSLYVTMQGPSEFGISGKLTHWDRSRDLAKLGMPTLVIGAKYDTMDPKYMEWMSTQIPKGQYLHCPNGSHMSLYDDQQNYMNGLIGFLESKKGHE